MNLIIIIHSIYNKKYSYQKNRKLRSEFFNRIIVQGLLPFFDHVYFILPSKTLKVVS